MSTHEQSADVPASRSAELLTRRNADMPTSRNAHLPTVARRRVQSPWRLVGAQMVRDRMAMLGGVIVALVILMAFVASLIAPQDPIAMTLGNKLQPPSSEHLMGTDDFGRDMLSRVVYGARVSLRVGLIAISIAIIVGGLLGLFTGYVGGWADIVVQRLIDIMLAFPALILALGIMAVLGPSLRNAMIAIGISGVPVYARVMRGQVLSLRQKEYVEAARAAGASHVRLVFRHILPNTISSMIAIATLGVADSILAASGLSYLGMGAQPPTPEWGAMLASGQEYLRHEWWIGTFPGVAIVLTVLGFNLLGDGLRDALDPRTVKKR